MQLSRRWADTLFMLLTTLVLAPLLFGQTQQNSNKIEVVRFRSKTKVAQTTTSGTDDAALQQAAKERALKEREEKLDQRQKELDAKAEQLKKQEDDAKEKQDQDQTDKAENAKAAQQRVTQHAAQLQAEWGNALNLMDQ